MGNLQTYEVIRDPSQGAAGATRFVVEGQVNSDTAYGAMGDGAASMFVGFTSGSLNGTLGGIVVLNQIVSNWLQASIRRFLRNLYDR